MEDSGYVGFGLRIYWRDCPYVGIYVDGMYCLVGGRAYAMCDEMMGSLESFPMLGDDKVLRDRNAGWVSADVRSWWLLSALVAVILGVLICSAVGFQFQGSGASCVV